MPRSLMRCECVTISAYGPPKRARVYHNRYLFNVPKTFGRGQEIEP